MRRPDCATDRHADDLRRARARGTRGSPARASRSPSSTPARLDAPDLDDLDFRHWARPCSADPPKVIDVAQLQRRGCAPPGRLARRPWPRHPRRRHRGGHRRGRPHRGRRRARGWASPRTRSWPSAKVLTDAGAGINSDLIAAMEWAAMPAGTRRSRLPSVGAQVVNMSLGSESRPERLNTGDDVDAVWYVLDRLASRYGTLFVVAQPATAARTSAPTSRRPGRRAAMSGRRGGQGLGPQPQPDASGDTCSGYQHPPPSAAANDCRGGPGDAAAVARAALVARPVGRPLAAAGRRRARLHIVSAAGCRAGPPSTATTSTATRAPIRSTRRRPARRWRRRRRPVAPRSSSQAYRAALRLLPSGASGIAGPAGAGRTRSSGPR